MGKNRGEEHDGRRDQHAGRSFEGTLSSWWATIVIGVLRLVRTMPQRFMLSRRP
jgi:hypothetical protein